MYRIGRTIRCSRLSQDGVLGAFALSRTEPHACNTYLPVSSSPVTGRVKWNSVRSELYPELAEHIGGTYEDERRIDRMPQTAPLVFGRIEYFNLA